MHKQFLTLGALFFAVIATGCLYSYGTWSGALKKRFHFEQSDIDTIGVLYSIAGVVSWLPGVFNDSFGPRLTVLIFGLICSFSYFGMWLIVEEVIPMSKNATFFSLTALSLGAFFGSSGVTGRTITLDILLFFTGGVPLLRPQKAQKALIFRSRLRLKWK